MISFSPTLYFLRYYSYVAFSYGMSKVDILIFTKGVIMAYQLDCAAINNNSNYKDYITGKGLLIHVKHSKQYKTVCTQ